MITPAMPGVTNGSAATREEAMAKFRDAWTKAKAGGCGWRPPLTRSLHGGEIGMPTSPLSISHYGLV